MAMLPLSGYLGPMLIFKAEMEAGAERSLPLREGRTELSLALLRGAFLPFFFAIALAAVVASSIRLLALLGQLAG